MLGLDEEVMGQVFSRARQVGVWSRTMSSGERLARCLQQEEDEIRARDACGL